MNARRVLRRVGRLSLALVVVAMAASLLDAGAAWRRVTRDSIDPFANDLEVCTDGIRLVLGSRFTGVNPGEQPAQMPREGFRVTSAFGEQVGPTGPGFPAPAGTDLLTLAPNSGVLAPQVDYEDPRLNGNPFNSPAGFYYLVEETHQWNEEQEVGAEVYLWLRGVLAETGWVPADQIGAVATAVVADCTLFGDPEPVSVRLDASTFGNPNVTYPQIFDFTVFEIRSSEVDPATVRFGAPGKERTAFVVQLGSKVYGLADLRARGLGCGSTTASVVGSTKAGLPFVGTDEVRPVCF